MTQEPRPRSLARGVLVALTGIVSVVYLVNPTAGVLEIIPDNFPLIGNLDEAAATALLLGALRYFKLDLLKAFRR